MTFKEMDKKMRNKLQSVLQSSGGEAVYPFRWGGVPFHSTRGAVQPLGVDSAHTPPSLSEVGVPGVVQAIRVLPRRVDAGVVEGGRGGGRVAADGHPDAGQHLLQGGGVGDGATDPFPHPPAGPKFLKNGGESEEMSGDLN